MLLREVVTQFKEQTEYTELLTTLLYLLQFNIRTTKDSLALKAQFADMVHLTLQIFNFVQAPIRKDQFIVHVVAENFHLYKHTNSQLNLKLIAMKTLLEIGANYTEPFLALIKQEATSLQYGVEF